jgi:hypothetical protein
VLVLTISSCSKTNIKTVSQHNLQPQTKGTIWQTTLNSEVDILSIIKSSNNSSNSQVRPESCSGGYTDQGYGVEYNCITGKYTLFFDMWILCYNYLNTAVPTNVSVNFLGVSYAPTTIGSPMTSSGTKYYKN